MNKLHVLGLTVALTLLASIAFASPMILGGSGGLLLPNAKTMQGISLGMGSFVADDSDLTWPATQIGVGVLKNLEVGYMFGSNPYGSTGLFNAKYALQLAGLDLAVGAQFGKDEVDGDGFVYYDDKVKDYYLVVGKQLGKSVNASLSLSSIKLGSNSSEVVPGLQIEKTLESGAKIGAELLFGKENSGLYENFTSARFGNAYVEFPIDKQLDVKAGLVGIGDSNYNTMIWLGATYAFGKNIISK